MNIPRNSTVAATFAVNPAPAVQARNPGTTPPLNGAPPTGAPEDPAATGAREVARSRSDTLELSSQGMRLSLTKGLESLPPEEPPPPEPVVSEATETPPLLGAKESSWQSERKSKLDRLETLVRQGQYKVDPFILDELAVRMARLMN